jgi:PilZ domain
MLGGPKNNEARNSPRTPIKMKVSLVMSEVGEVLAITRDISDGGIFVLLDTEKVPEVGEEVSVQVQGLPDAMDAPWVKMRVVRTEAKGIGLMIVS